MNMQQLIERCAKDLNFHASDTEKCIQKTFEIISRELIKNSEVKLKGFGTFKKYRAKARAGRNPQTGEKLRNPAQWRVKLQVSDVLKQKLNKKK